MKKIICFLLALTSLAFSKEYQLDKQIPPISEPYFFGAARGLAARSNGDIYAASRRVTRMNAADHVLFSFPPMVGMWDWEIRADGLAADTSGNVWAVERLRSWVIKYGPNGDVLWSTGYSNPTDVAVDPSGNVFISFSSRGYPAWCMIAKFDQDGNYISTFGETGSDPGQTAGPVGICCDASGNVYVADGHWNYRISKFDNNGSFVMMFGSQGTGPGQFSRLDDVAVDSQGNIYVFESFRVQKFSSTGQFITQWGEEGIGEGKFKVAGSARIAVGANDTIYTYEDNGVQKWDCDGNFLGRLSTKSSQAGRFDYLTGVAYSNAGELFAADANNNRFQKFDRKGQWVAAVGGPGTGPGQFNRPRGIAVSDEELIFIADTENHRIQVFNKKLEFVTAFGEQGANYGEFNRPSDVAADRDGNLYVLDNGNQRVQKFNKNYQFVTHWPKTADLDFINPTGIAVDSRNNVYVADTGQYRICKFDSTGNLLLTFGRDEAIYSDLDGPSDVAVDNAGRIFVADGYERVKVFDATGSYLFSFGEGELQLALYLDIAENGDLLVSDVVKNQLLVYGRGHAVTVAAAARTPGAYGTQWRTDLGLFNPDSASKALTLALYPSGQDGTNPLTIPVNLNPLASVFIGDLISQFGLTEGVGAIGIIPDSGEEPGVFSRTYNQTAEGTYGQYIPGTGFGDGFRLHRNAHLTGLKSTGEYRTNLGFANLRDGPVDLWIAYFGPEGGERTRQTVSLPPYSHLQINDVPRCWGIGEAMEGGYVIAGTEDPFGLFVAYASVVDNRTGDPVFIAGRPDPPIESEKLDLFLPAVARAAGAHGSDWRTELTLTNEGADDLQVSLTFWEHDRSNTAPDTRTVAVPAGGAVTIPDVLSDLFGRSETYGPLLLHPEGTGLLAHSRTYHTGATGTYGQSIPAFGTSDRRSEAVYLLEYNQTWARRTNIGLINFADHEETFVLELLNGGVVIASESRTVSEYSMIQFPGPWGGEHFTLRITPQSDQPFYFAYASLVDNSTQDPIFQYP